MGTSKDILIDRISELEQEVKELKKNKKHIYVHEIQALYMWEGELHIECEQGTIVFNLETLYNDLPNMLAYCIEEHKKKEQRIKKEITQLIKK
tara:strand:+ start:4904 stop:5182 length:279 start_codon:yes stop_codon:yes gene_type:complete